MIGTVGVEALSGSPVAAEQGPGPRGRVGGMVKLNAARVRWLMRNASSPTPSVFPRVRRRHFAHVGRPVDLGSGMTGVVARPVLAPRGVVVLTWAPG